MEIFEITKQFPETERYGLSSQMQRAAYSIPSNIVEGCGRETDNEFKRYLVIARGSAAELEYFLILVKDLKYIGELEFDRLTDQVNKVKRSLNNLIEKI